MNLSFQSESIRTTEPEFFSKAINLLPRRMKKPILGKEWVLILGRIEMLFYRASSPSPTGSLPVRIKPRFVFGL